MPTVVSVGAQGPQGPPGPQGESGASTSTLRLLAQSSWVEESTYEVENEPLLSAIDAVRLGSKLYMVVTTPDGDLVEYDLDTETWTEHGPMPVAGSYGYAEMVAWEGTLLLAWSPYDEGTDSYGFQIDRYDIASQTWDADIAPPRPNLTLSFGLAVHIAERSLYVIGGDDPANNYEPTTTVDVLDLDAFSWSAGTALQTATSAIKAAYRDEVVWFAGGGQRSIVAFPPEGTAFEGYWVEFFAPVVGSQTMDIGTIDGKPAALIFSSGAVVLEFELDWDDGVGVPLPSPQPRAGVASSPPIWANDPAGELDSVLIWGYGTIHVFRLTEGVAVEDLLSVSGPLVGFDFATPNEGVGVRGGGNFTGVTGNGKTVGVDGVGEVYGIRGTSPEGVAGIGVGGFADEYVNSRGVFGVGEEGVVGHSHTGSGVVGEATNIGKYGVYGWNQGGDAAGAGVYGNGGGSNPGIKGDSTSGLGGSFKSIGVGNSQAATGPVGSIVRKIQIFDRNGTSLGYIPVYNTIT